ncbi:hypothetical protein [Brevibacillus dissolubilis]|uniref:hypothetical protein n=1 Tax=Brevibacillus dissolubilis TaxID=1844116 RepID=UPI0011160262|nr:hypothetical protein [Brevibacillus dissolubilis]
MIYVALIVILTLIGGIATFMIGLNPKEENYGKRTKNNMVRLVGFYVISAIILLVIFSYYVL